MLVKRTITIFVLAAIGIPVILLGGVYYFVLMTFFLAVAAWEYGQIFGKAGYRVSQPILIGSVLLIAAVRTFLPDFAAAAFSISILITMTWHLIGYEKGRDQAASDFAVTTAGIVYLGWIGAYLLDLRSMPDGMWWLLIVLPTIWIADIAAYLVGSRIGKRRLSPRLSPKKTWEGYWAGVIFGTLGTLGLVLLWRSLGGPDLSWWQALVLGAVLTVLTTLGDLGESMIKRQAGVKDASNFFPGHGGVFDRIDSWLWGAVLGYFFILWFLI